MISIRPIFVVPVVALALFACNDPTADKPKATVASGR